MKFDQEEPGVPGQAVSTYFAMATPDVDTAYMAVSRGTATHVIDERSGAEVAASSMPEATSNLAPKADANVTPPRSDATWLSSAPVWRRRALHSKCFGWIAFVALRRR